MEVVIDRFLEFCELKKIRQVDLVKLKVASHPTINGIFNKKNVPNTSTLQNMLMHFPDMNIKWLLTGEGSLLVEESGAASGSQQKLIELEQQLSDCKKERERQQADKEKLQAQVEKLTSIIQNLTQD